MCKRTVAPGCQAQSFHRDPLQKRGAYPTGRRIEQNVSWWSKSKTRGASDHFLQIYMDKFFDNSLWFLSAPPSKLSFQMRDSFEKALAPGTIRNQHTQATLYIKFMLIYQFNYLFPTVANIAMYSRFLANSYTSKSTIRNYLSGAKSWVYLHMGDICAFSAYERNTLVKSYVSSSQHVPAKAALLSTSDIRLICAFIDANPLFPCLSSQPFS